MGCLRRIREFEMWGVCEVPGSLRHEMLAKHQRVGNVRCLQCIRELEM